RPAGLRLMETDRAMYGWRRMTPERRKAAMEYRQRHHLPWHSLPHYVGAGLYLLTAACFEHRPIIGFSPQRMGEFESELLETLRPHARATFAWTVLPNHYHVLVHAPDITDLLKAIGRLHGRTSFR